MKNYQLSTLNSSFDKLRILSLPNGQLRKGFTLIELLVVIAVLAVLSVGLIAAINPLDKVNASGDARVLSDVGVMARALESYVSNQGFYPELLSSVSATATQELKSVPIPPKNQCGANTIANVYDGGTDCDYSPLPAACTTACTNAVITAKLKSNKYTGANTPVWRYETSTGKSCAVATITTACP